MELVEWFDWIKCYKVGADLQLLREVQIEWFDSSDTISKKTVPGVSGDGVSDEDAHSGNLLQYRRSWRALLDSNQRPTA